MSAFARPGWIHILLAALVAGWAAAAGAVAEAEPMEEEAMTSDAMPAEDEATGSDAMPAEPAPAADGTLARSGFTTAVVEREPVDGVTTLSNDQEEIAYFTELRGFEGHTVVHRWEHGGEVMAEVPFEVDGPRWRVHSTKRLDPSWLGTWSVSVLVDGQVISQEEFNYTAAPMAAEAPEETDTEASAPAPAAPAADAE